MKEISRRDFLKICGALAGELFIENVYAGRKENEIVIRLPEQKLYIKDFDGDVLEYDVSTGRPGHRTPPGDYKVRKIIRDPWWDPRGRPWASRRIKRWCEKHGPLPPWDRRNPLGKYWIYIGKHMGIHDIDGEWKGGFRSHGCIRMKHEDIEYIVESGLVHVGMDVKIRDY